MANEVEPLLQFLEGKLNAVAARYSPDPTI